MIGINMINDPYRFPDDGILKAEPNLSIFKYKIMEMQQMAYTDINPSLTSFIEDEINKIQQFNNIEVSDKWNDPKKITDIRKPEDYPIESLPSTIKNAVNEVVSFVQCPVALAASSALSVLSLAIQPYFNVARSNTLVSPVSLYFLSVAESGARKSSSDKRFKEVVVEYEDRKKSELIGDILAYQSNLTIWEEQQKGLNNKLREMTAKLKDTSDIETKIREHMRNKPIKPLVPKLFYTDFSFEALAKGLYEIWPSAAIMSAEGGIVFGSYGMNKDSVVKTLASCNELWDGSPISFDKISSGSFTLKDVRLTISLQVQKDILLDFIRKNKDITRGSGFLARFLICEQILTNARVYKDEPLKFDHIDLFKNKIRDIIKKDPEIVNGRLMLETIKFDNKAKQKWIDFHNTIEERMVNNGLYSDITDFASKAAENIARLSALFHIIEHGYSDICKDCVIKAKDIVKWHLHEAQRLFGHISKLDSSVRKFDEWLKKYCKDKSITKIDMRTAQQHSHMRAEELKSILPILEEHYHLRVVDDGKAVEINPKLLSQ